MQVIQQPWDIFCSVIDNYGDVGVAWRLARQLVAEHAIAVRLFVDDLDALRRIAPHDALGVDVRQWRGPAGDFSARDAAPAEVVVEAFGCGLPAMYLDAMCMQTVQPLWINLEYLSAESWIEDSHGLASRLPQRPLTRYFYFPGFTARTGGLLRERGLLARRDAYRGDRAARDAFWGALNLEPPAPDTLTMSLFCYSNRALSAMLDAWAEGGRPIRCIVPEGVAGAELGAWAGRTLWPGQCTRRRDLTLAAIAFVPQDDYDKLLWACDLNFVRGEDSFVRAQWAARPLVWHAYPQADDAHLAKLAAFLSRYGAGLAPGVASAQSEFMTGWNCGTASVQAWEAFAAALPALSDHAESWADTLASVPDLAAGLVEFARKLV
jgi:uncharacterized repeat protein (TIGR03837 family)